MAYTTKQAVDTIDRYLEIDGDEKKYIDNTKERGFVIELKSGEKAVIFVYPLVHKQDNTKNYFDTRDSGAYERGVAWKYALQNGMKYFCFGVNDQVDKYDDFIFSLECNEKVIEKISGTKDGSRNGPGNQIIIPNDYVPKLNFERIKNRLGIYIAVINKNSLMDYIEKYDNRPYMNVSIDTFVESDDEDAEERNKRLFREWMEQQVKPKGDSDAGNPYTTASIDQYVSNIANTALLGRENRSLFYTSDASEVESVIKALDSTEKKNNTQRSAVKKYLQYINETQDIQEYERAAKYLKDYVLESGLVFEENEETVRSIYDDFRAKFAPEQLLNISDGDLLGKMFYTAESTNDSMCYWLEFEQRSYNYCGSISGGSSYKYGLFQRKEDSIWITGSPNKPEELTVVQALEIAKNIRDVLVKGSEIIKSATLETLDDYEELDANMNEAIGKYAAIGWVHKYFHMLYPDKLCAFHSAQWQRHILFALRIRPSERYYARSGQIAMVAKYTGWVSRHFYDAFMERFGGVKKFFRLGTSDDEKNYAEEWKRQQVAAIGWSALESLEDYVTGNDINKTALTDKMFELYYSDNRQLASRKAGEIATFYRTNKDSVFVAMNGNTLLAMIDEVGKYYYDSESCMAHKKPGTWHCCFAEEDMLPNKAAGFRTSCYELTDDDNLLYLYEKYYYDLTDREEEGEEEMQETADKMEYIKPEYNTGFETDFERNRIVFGAPGTGKSYQLKTESEELIGDAETHMERVTFHSDYTYSQFVGSYKPVTDVDGKIRYDFVPGPFMRVYVNAIKNIQQIERIYRLIENAEVMHMFPTNPNPDNEDEKWDLFEEITEVGQEETFRASKEAKAGDLALIYVAKTKPGYDNGIYAIGTIVGKKPDDEVIIRFDYVSYYMPIISYDDFKDYNPNIRSNGRVGEDIVNLVKETVIPANPYLLLIEEINRAKVAAVFGDVFQLLDRDDDGISEYEIQTSEDVRKYLASQLGGKPKNWLKIKLPDNMFIWATMNSADQGVFPMDTAFKRRWDFSYLGINENEEEIEGIGRIELAGSDEPVEWNILRKAINEKMASEDFKINEDKLMGPFFLSKKVIASDDDGMIIDTEKFMDAFKSKVIMYLYEDAVRQGKRRFFDGCDSSKYSSVCDAFDEIGMGIFGANFKELFYDKQREDA